MGLGWLLIPALAGYWFLTHWNWTRFQAERASGYHLLFRSAIAGGLLLTGAYVLLTLLSPLCPQDCAAWTAFVPFPYAGTFVLSAGLGYVLPFLLNRYYSRQEAARHAIARHGNLIEQLMAEAIERQVLVQLSLKSGKVYVGLGLASALAGPDALEISLIPLASGYRAVDTQTMHLTTYYAPVLEKLTQHLTDEDFRVVIPLTEVVSARLFDFEAHIAFQAGESPTPTRSDGPAAGETD